LAQVALRLINKKTDLKVVILAGVGLNGAAGFCAARHLANHNVKVVVCRSRAYQLADENVHQRKIYKETGGKEAQIGSLPVEPVALIIDALIGIGLRSSPTDTTLTLIQWANANGAPILAYDVPSGVDSTTGRAVGEYIKATTTMTIALPKTGLIQSKTGSLYVADVGIPQYLYNKLGINYTSPFGDQFILKLKRSK